MVSGSFDWMLASIALQGGPHVASNSTNGDNPKDFAFAASDASCGSSSPSAVLILLMTKDSLAFESAWGEDCSLFAGAGAGVVGCEVEAIIV